MKKHSFVILSLIIPLLFTSCLAEFLNAKFGFNHPLYIKYDIFDGVRSDDTKKVYPGYVLTAEDVKSPYNPYDMANPFLGWFLEPTYMTPVYEGFVVNEDITLYGRWTNDYRSHPNENVYILNYNVLDYDPSTSTYGYTCNSTGMMTGSSTYTPQETLGECRLIQGAEDTQICYNYEYNGVIYPTVTVVDLKYYNPEVSIANFQKLLANLPDNSIDNPYYIKLTGSDPYFPAYNDVSNYSGTKMIHLDLTGYTCQSFGGSETFKGKLWLREITLNIPTGTGTFMNCSNLAKANLLSGVDSIGNEAFSGCTSLKEITIPYGPTQISQRAFYNCTSLKTVSIPDSVDTIMSQAFEGCSSLEEIIIPNGTSAISQSLFKNCISLKTVFIPYGVGTIMKEAFAGCSNLESIFIPESVDLIIDEAFAGINAAILRVYYQGDEDDRVRLFTNCASDTNNSTIFSPAAHWDIGQTSYW